MGALQPACMYYMGRRFSLDGGLVVTYYLMYRNRPLGKIHHPSEKVVYDSNVLFL